MMNWSGATSNYKLEYKPGVFSDVSVEDMEAMVGDWDSRESTKVLVPAKGYVPIPREQCSFGEASYSFSGHTSKPRPWTPLMLQIRKRVSTILGLPEDYFTFALVNLYRNGNDSISPHKDSKTNLDPASPIVSVSLGARRKFVVNWASVPQPGKKEFALGEGDLLAMWPPTNTHCVHSVPKEPSVLKKRISITFRRIIPSL